MTVADRIGVMDHGKLIQVATPAEIYEQPNSKYVADFIGDINILEGRVARSDAGRMRIEGLPVPGAVDVSSDVPCKVGDQVWFAVRPEKVRINHAAPTDSGVNAVEGQVWDIGYIGDTSIYHVHLPNGSTMRSTVANTSREVERPIGWDDKVWLTWSPDAGIVLMR